MNKPQYMYLWAYSTSKDLRSVLIMEDLGNAKSGTGTIEEEKTNEKISAISPLVICSHSKLYLATSHKV